MDKLWSFSETSQDMLRKCIEASNQDDNKWSRAFNFHKNNRQETKMKSEEKESANTDIAENFEDICTKLCNNPSEYCYLLEEHVTNRNFVNFVANSLNHLCAIEVVELLLKNSKIASQVEKFFCIFLPIYFKRANSDESIFLLEKIKSDIDIAIFKKIFIQLLKCTDLSEVVSKFVFSLSPSEQSEFLFEILTANLEGDLFLHYLDVIYKLYIRSEKIQNLSYLMLTNLIRHSEVAMRDSNFLRLLIRCRKNLSSAENSIDTDKIGELIKQCEKSNRHLDN